MTHKKYGIRILQTALTYKENQLNDVNGSIFVLWNELIFFKVGV